MSGLFIGSAQQVAEQLQAMAGNGQVFEAFVRNKDGRMQPFLKFMIQNAKQSNIDPEKINRILKGVQQIQNMNALGLVEEAANLGVNIANHRKLIKIDGKIDTLLDLAENISSLQKFSLVLESANLCATAVGFAIMYQKLDKMSNQISEVLDTVKEQEGIHESFKFNTVLSEYNDMLDCIEKGKPYSEKEYRKLIDNEFNILDMLIKGFTKNVVADKEDTLYAILSLSCMLSTTICYFDEVYYYTYKETSKKDKKWHNSHDIWIGIYKTLTSKKFQAKVQDLCFLDLGLNQYETDLFVGSIVDSTKESKQIIKNNQDLIELMDTKEKLMKVRQLINQSIELDVKQALDTFDDKDKSYLTKVFSKAEEQFGLNF